MADGLDRDGGALSEGELEDGEVLSSDEEEAGGEGGKSNVTPEERPPAKEHTDAPEPASAASKRPAPEDEAAGATPEKVNTGCL